MEWYYSHSGRIEGPAPAERVEALIREGWLTPDDRVSTDGQTGWTSIASCPDFADASEAAARSAPAAAESPKLGGYIARHWRGDLSLAQSYWFNVVLVGVASNAGSRLLEVSAERGDAGRSWVIAFLAALALSLLIAVWQVVGTWRSARHHRQRTGRVFWASVTQVVLALSTLGAVLTYVSIAPSVVEHVEIALGIDEYSDYEVTASDDGRTVRIAGSIGFGLTGDLRDSVPDPSRIETLILDSRGGRLAEARRLRDFVAANAIPRTITRTGCASACLLPFLAGETRAVTVDGRLGFHRYSVSGARAADPGEDVRIDSDYYHSRGLDEAFIRRAFETPPDTLWTPGVHPLFEAGAINAVYDAGEFIDQREYVARRLQALETELASEPMFAALRRVGGTDFESLIEALYLGSEGVIDRAVMTERAQAVYGRVIGRHLPETSDHAAQAFGALLVTQLEYLAAIDRKRCYAYLYPDGNHALPEFPADLAERERAVSARVIEDALDDPRPPPDETRALAILEPVFEALGETGEFLFEPTAPGADPGAVCEGAIGFYRAVAAMPPADAGDAIRFMLQE